LWIVYVERLAKLTTDMIPSSYMNWYYIAGFFDGEGALTHNGKGYRIYIAQANEEVLINIQGFLKSGHIIKIKKRKIHWKDSWVFYISKQEDVYSFILHITPYLIVKKQLVNRVLPALKKNMKIQHQKKLVLEKRKKLAKELRNKGLSYRTIGRKLSIDWGYARRLILKTNNK